jgi:hypothetical protein
VTKPLLNLPKYIENYAKGYGEYAAAFAKMNMLVQDIQVHKALSPEAFKLFNELRTRTADLIDIDDPSPSATLIRKLQIEVNSEIDIETLWLPTTSPPQAASSPKGG